MSETTLKFTEEELNQIKSLQTEYQQKLSQFGELKFAEVELQKQINELSKRDESLKQEYLAIQQKEKELTTSLNTKYGDGVLDMETGEFTKK